MKAVLWDEPFSDPDWIFERKLDGVRCLAHRDGGGAVRLFSRTDRSMNADYPEPRGRARGRAVPGLRRRRRGRGLRQPRGHELPAPPAPRRASASPVFLYLFDVLRLDGEDIRELPLRERKAELRRALDFERPVRFTPHRNEHGEQLFREACRKGLEGIIAKRADSPYRATPLERLAQAQVPRRAGARDRRLHRAAGVAHGLRRAAGRLLRGRRGCATPARSAPASTTTRCARWARACASSSATTRRSPTCTRSRAARTGSSPSWSRRSRSASGPATAACATRASSACATTRRPRDVVRERPA